MWKRSAEQVARDFNLRNGGSDGMPSDNLSESARKYLPS